MPRKFPIAPNVDVDPMLGPTCRDCYMPVYVDKITGHIGMRDAKITYRHVIMHPPCLDRSLR